MAVRATVQARYTASAVEIRTVEPDRISEFVTAGSGQLTQATAGP
ncbi:MAG TPA: hypothetical protein VF838_06940 [Trebonia sp.]